MSDATKPGEALALFFAGRQNGETDPVLARIGRPMEMSFDPNTTEGAEMLLKATLDDLKGLKDNANRVINVVHVFSHAATANKKDGEVVPIRRTVVFDDKGEGYDCGSDGVDKALGIIKAIRRNPPWNPPVECTIVVRDIGDGKQWMVLRPNAEKLLANRTTPKA